MVLKDYKKIKKLASITFKLKFYSQCIDIISVAAGLMYYFNIKYYDEELENILQQISDKIFQDRIKIENVGALNTKRVVLYDFFSLDNRGLTEQYLQALIDLNCDILYISLQKDVNKMKEILKKINGYEKGSVVFINSKNNLNACYTIREKIIQFNPSSILFHSAPWDSIGCIVLFSLPALIKRYLINLTDHAFWLGKKCNDFFLEFRSYGFNISLKYRGIDEKKLLILPYYPVNNPDLLFQGFPFEYENKKIIFSGGSLYKISGSQVFFDIVKYILDKYPEAIFLYLGNGDKKDLYKFISINKFENRFYIGNERKDINEIFKRCYFYIGTYPVAGGLMTQYAVMNNKIPVLFSDKNLLLNNVEELFMHYQEDKFSYSDINLLYEEIDKLFIQPEYYYKKTQELSNLVISQNKFAQTLDSCLQYQNSEFTPKLYNVDNDSVVKLYLKQSLNYGNKFFIVKNAIIAFVFFPYTIRAVINKIKNYIWN